MLVLAKAVGPVGDDLHLVGHRFERASGQAPAGSGKDAIEVFVGHPGKADKRLEPAVGGHQSQCFREGRAHPS